jgi:DNA-directed RNA polymerase specialized sigma24 family protein
MRANDAVAVLRAEKHPISPARRPARLEELQGAIAQLPPQVQAVLLLHRRDGYTLDEIAKELGLTLANAAQCLAKALLHCCQSLHSRIEPSGRAG